jgi:hypothetical protein
MMTSKKENNERFGFGYIRLGDTIRPFVSYEAVIKKEDVLALVREALEREDLFVISIQRLDYRKV